MPTLIAPLVGGVGLQAGTPSAFAFRLDPRVVLKGRPTSLYPEIPFGIYLVTGRNFLGFHVRFLDVARGGIRLVLSREKMAHDRNKATLFNECYNLALTQHLKNKDIPEGGGQGVILPDPTHLFVKKSEPNAKAAPPPLRQRVRCRGRLRIAVRRLYAQHRAGSALDMHAWRRQVHSHLTFVIALFPALKCAMHPFTHTHGVCRQKQPAAATARVALSIVLSLARDIAPDRLKP